MDMLRTRDTLWPLKGPDDGLMVEVSAGHLKMPGAFCFALPSAGRSKLARIAMMAMTTSNSIRVKPGQGMHPGDWLNRVRVFTVNVCLCYVLRQRGEKVTRKNPKSECRNPKLK